MQMFEDTVEELFQMLEKRMLDRKAGAGLTGRLSIFQDYSSLSAYLTDMTAGDTAAKNAMKTALSVLQGANAIPVLACKLYEVRECCQYSHLKCRTWRSFCQEFLHASEDAVNAFIDKYMHIDIGGEDEIFEQLGGLNHV